MDEVERMLLPAARANQILSALPAQQIPLATVPVEDCAWCWYASNPNVAYPESWSSTICTEHAAWMLTARQSRKLQKREVRP
ncbi:MAG TPA: hypothetical protein VF026_21265 [Ktedonobacteraceae bacterium]